MAESSVKELAVALGERLSLTVDEDVGLSLDDGEDTQQQRGGDKWCLVGTVLTRKRYHMELMERTLAEVWRPVKGMHMRILGNNLFAFYFFHPVDMKRVLAEGPWRFDNHVMVLQEAQGGRQVVKEELCIVPFWIQIHNLPPDRLTMDAGKSIGSAMGRLLEVDVGEGSIWETKYIRVRVGIDARRPLRRGMKLALRESRFGVFLI
ncbi:hypothetical protein SLA2020_189540 [Shorea laevis]